MDQGLRGLGLTRTTWCVLLALGNEGLSQPSEIASFIGIDRTATSRALRQMCQAGLIRREPGDGDARTRRVRLTERGSALLSEGEPLARANNAILSQRAGEEATEELKDALERIIEGEPLLRKL